MKSSPDIYTDDEIREMTDEELRVALQTQKDFFFWDKCWCGIGLLALLGGIASLTVVKIDPAFDGVAWLLIQIVILWLGIFFSIYGSVWYWRHMRSINRIKRMQRVRRKLRIVPNNPTRVA